MSTATAVGLKVRKRDGSVVSYEQRKITQVVRLCLVNGCGKPNNEETEKTVNNITHGVEKMLRRMTGDIAVETIQDLIVLHLRLLDPTAADNFAAYREEHRKLRDAGAGVDPVVMQTIREDRKNFATDVQAFQHYDKYARFNHDAKRRETFTEASDRQIDYLRWEVEERHGRAGVIQPAEWTMLRRYIIEAKATPSMRLQQTAGPAAKRCNVGIYNCLSVDTPFVTSEGVRCFSDFKDGDMVEVLTHANRWRKAVVRSYGYQAMHTISFSRGRSTATVRATPDHRWLLDSPVGSRRHVAALSGREQPSLLEAGDDNKSVWETTSLGVGDRLARAPMPFVDWSYDNAEPLERLYWAYGYVYGDGTTTHSNGNTYSMARLCKKDAGRFLARFEELGFGSSSSLSCAGDPMVYTGSYDKRLPDIAKDGVAMVRAFVRGWLDADGAKQTCATSVNPFGSLQVTGDDGIAFVREIFPAVGVYVTREENLTGQVTNYGKRSGTTIRFGLLAGVGDKHNGCYNVTELSSLGKPEEAWCLEVEEDHSFTLANGLVTGNCSYCGITDLDYFHEGLYISMQGTGHAFSVEAELIEQLPQIQFQRNLKPDEYVVEDTTEGWCRSTKLLTEALYDGHDLRVIYDELRPAGTPLKTKGGTASGPDPLRELHQAIRRITKARQGKRLRDIDAHDIMCFVGRAGEMGGFRRAAELSMSDLDSMEMRLAKATVNGKGFWDDPSKVQRTMANNSAAYWHKPAPLTFLDEWVSLAKSRSGERGIFNRGSLVSHQFPQRRADLYRDQRIHWGCNPCGEIILHPDGQFCNLSIAIVRPDDDESSLLAKVEIAAIFGTLQSMLTSFNYLRPNWKESCEKERLLGVDLLGALDCPLLRAENPDRERLLGKLKERAVQTNAAWAARLGINASNAVTCIKPGGNSGVRFGTGQSMSGWLTPHMLRHVEVGRHNPMHRFLVEQGVPHEISYRDPDTSVFIFPLKAPEGAMIVADLDRDEEGNLVLNEHGKATIKPRRTAVEQLEDWLVFKKNWTEHNPSVSIYVADDEWLEVGNWVYSHWDDVGGLAFFPLDNGVYEQAPFTPVTEKAFNEFLAKFPVIQWEKLPRYDGGVDRTDVLKESACAGGACEI
jgi:ribonucleoside-triphosphate reductase